MYCPVDGAEYREGYTRCPDHNVELVEFPPEDLEEDEPFFIFNLDTAIRVVFIVFVIAAGLYAILGASAAALFAAAGPRGNPEWAITLQSVGLGVSRVAYGTFGILAGAVVVQILLRMRRDEEADRGKRWLAASEGRKNTVMRFLFALFVLQVLIYAGTSLATSRLQGEFRAGLTSFESGVDEEPSEATILLFTLNIASYAIGVAAFGLMAGKLIVDVHSRISAVDEERVEA